jgi:hypothetical protein
MSIMPSFKVGELAQCTIAGKTWVCLVLATSPATHRGRSPLIKVQWVGESPRDLQVEHVEDRLLKPLQ